MYFYQQRIIKYFVVAGLLCSFFIFASTILAQEIRLPTKAALIKPLLEESADAISAQNFTRAKTILQKALSIAPQDAMVNTLAGIVAERENDLSTAERYFGTAARLQPKSAEMRNNYGAILLRLNRKTQAAREFAASLKINPNQPSALVNLAQIRFVDGHLPAARELFEKAKVIQPDIEIVRSLLIISINLKEYEKAKRYYQDYLILANDSIHQTGRRELGKLLLENGLTAEAIQELKAFLILDPLNIDALIYLSQAHLQQKEIRLAGRLLESAIAQGSEDARIYAALADVYEAGGYMENAIPAMRLAIEKDSGNEFYRARYGLLLINSKAPAAAIIRLQEAVKEFPKSSRLWLALGIAQQIDGKMIDAQNSFEKSLQIEPQSVPALAYLATSLMERAQYAEAVNIYKQALVVEENNAVLHYLLADTLLRMSGNDTKLIEKHLIRAIQLDEKLSPAHLALGRLYARVENWQQAAIEFKQAVRHSPDLTEAYYQLGRALARLKRADESRSAFEKFKKLSEAKTLHKETDRQELIRRLANVRF